MSSSTKRNNTDDLICPISLELPFDPVMAEDGRVYERSAIEEYFQGKNADRIPSPLTREIMGKRLLPALQHKGTIEILIENGVIEGDLAAKWNEKAQQKKDMEELLEKAEKGDVEAMFGVGIDYYGGKNGPEQDYELAYTWFKKAHDGGHITATAYAGELLVKGLGVEENYVQGVAYLCFVAKESNLAAFLLGMAFADGMYGLPIDTTEGRRLLELVVNRSCTCKHLTDSAHERATAKLEELKNSS